MNNSVVSEALPTLICLFPLPVLNSEGDSAYLFSKGICMFSITLLECKVLVQNIAHLLNNQKVNYHLKYKLKDH